MKFRVNDGMVVPDVEQHFRMDSNGIFRWVAGSDVQKVWRKYGWQPPSEYRTDYLFKQNREGK